MTRKDFLKTISAASFAATPSLYGKMRPDEQAAHDCHGKFYVDPGLGLLDSNPFLQTPAEDSVGVAFAVTALASGYAEVADNPEMKGAVRFRSEGFPYSPADSRILQVRITGLKPGTRYWYRVGAAAMGRPIGYWTKQSEIQWSDVHTFLTSGISAPSHFAAITDTHGKSAALRLILKKMRNISAPVSVWTGDVPPSLIDEEETAVKLFLKQLPGDAGLASDAPCFFLSGNHDYRGQWYQQNPYRIMMARRAEERSVRDLALCRNFAVRQGDIAMIGLETGEDKPDSHPAHGGNAHFEKYRAMQADWLRDQFKRPEIASAPYVVAFCHIPLFDARPEANPGNILENWADYQKECADQWGPILTENGVQLVVCGHKHKLRFDPADSGRSWAQIVGGGPELGYVGWGPNKRPDSTRFPTVVEGKVEAGKLVVRAHNVLSGTVAACYEFAPRKCSF
ncbi:MAG: metallophosphoesterase [Kiritimatiellae bacterium]|nr:metallophosphoesterase [Kiritimatiellia bacterium]